VLYQAFSRREVNISMLDARAGTPPTAGELLRRHHEAGEMQSLDQLLRDWERWSADLLESHRLIRSSAISARSTTTNPGYRRYARCWTHARWSWSGLTACPSGRRN